MNIIPAGGESWGRAFAQIGQTIAKFQNPYREQEDMFQKLVATKPELMDDFIAQEQKTPGSLGKIFGKKVSEYVAQQPLSEAYQRKVAEQKLNIDTAKQNLATGAITQERQKQGLTADTMKNLQSQTLWDAINSNETTKKFWSDNQNFGGPQEELDEKVKLMKQRADRAPLAEPFVGKTQNEIAEAIRTGAAKPNAETVQAMWERMPNAMVGVMALLDDANREKLSIRLKGMEAGDQDRYLRNLRWRETVSEAQKLGVSPNAYAKKFFGTEFSELAPPSTPEQDAQLDTKLEDIRTGEMRKSAIADINDIQQAMGQIQKGGLNDEKKGVQYGIMNTSLQRLGEKLPEGTPIPQYKHVEKSWYQPDTRGWFIKEPVKDAKGNITYQDRQISDPEMLQFFSDLNAKILTNRTDYRPRNTATDSTSTSGRVRNPNSMDDNAKLNRLP